MDFCSTFILLIYLIGTVLSAGQRDTQRKISPSRTVRDEKVRSLLLRRIGDGTEDGIELLMSENEDGRRREEEGGGSRVLVTVATSSDDDDRHGQGTIASLVEELNSELFCYFTSPHKISERMKKHDNLSERDFSLYIKNVNAKANTDTMLTELPDGSLTRLSIQQDLEYNRPVSSEQNWDSESIKLNTLDINCLQKSSE